MSDAELASWTCTSAAMRDVITYAVDEGVCSRCVLLASVARTQSRRRAVCRAPLAECDALLDSLLGRHAHGHCSACAGVLQLTAPAARHLLRSALHALAVTGACDCQTSVALCSGILIRQAHWLARLKQCCELNEVDTRVEYDLRTLLKLVVHAAWRDDALPFREDSLLHVRIHVDHDALATAHQQVANCPGVTLRFKPKVKRRRGADKFASAKRRRFVRQRPEETVSLASLNECLSTIGHKIVDLFPSPLPKLESPPIFELVLATGPIWVGGKYMKLKRGISNSPWNVGSERVGSYSIEEYISAELHNVFETSDHAFRSSGREDIDVRMLGTGRPFLFEIINPRCLAPSVERLEAAQRAINAAAGDAMRVSHLQLVSADAPRAMEAGAADKRKTYRALVQLSARATDDALVALNARRDIAVSQLTPMRVAHRRAPLVRERVVHRAHAQRLSGTWLCLTLSTSAGTYVKEFVNGDLGRSTPSLASLLGVCEARIALLDVIDVGLVFPPDQARNAHIEPPLPPVPLFDALPNTVLHTKAEQAAEARTPK